MRRQQNIRSRRFERHPPFRPDHGVAQMDAAADAEGTRQRLQPLNDRNRRLHLSIEGDRRSPSAWRRPVPTRPPSASSRSMIETGDCTSPSRLTGIPALKPIVCLSGALGFENASFDSTPASSGKLPPEVSVSWPPMVTPHRPRFTEYAAPNGGMGS